MRELPSFLKDLAAVSAMTGAQLLREYFGGDRAALRNALRQARASGFAEVSVELVRPRTTTAPIAVVGPGDPKPNPGQIAYAASRLWSDDFTPSLVVRGTAQLATLCGATPRSIVTGHLSHEIALTDVFLEKRRTDPAFSWTLISPTAARGGRADAVSCAAMIELVGRYSRASVAGKLALSAGATIEFW